MKEGQFVASQQLKNLRTGVGSASTTSASTSTTYSQRQQSTQQQQRQADVYDAVNYIFTLMSDAFPLQYAKAFPNDQSINRARNLWSQMLMDLAPQQIKRAAIKAVKDGKFLPSLSELRRLALERDYKELGLHGPQQAYYEACRATNRTRNGVWSHVAVYLAARETSWSLLESEPQMMVYPIFKRNYEILCNRLLAGEDLEAGINKGLENHARRDALVHAQEVAERKLRAEMEARDIDPHGGRAEFLRIMAKL